MNVFLAGIIQGSIADSRIHPQDWRRRVKLAISRALPGATVYCHYSEHPASIRYGRRKMLATLEDGLKRAAACDLLVAYVPGASMGTAIEMYLASKAGAAVLTISPLKTNWVLRAYSDRIFDSIDEFERHLAKHGGRLAGGRASCRRRGKDKGR